MKPINAPLATESALAAIDTAIKQIAPPASMKAWFQGYASAHRERLAQDLVLIDHFAPDAKDIVEVGAIPLILTAALAERDVNLTAVDLSPDRFSETIGRLGLHVEKANIEHEPLPLADQSADLVLLNEVFEHLRVDLIFTMSEILRILKPHGILLMSTPNLRSIKGLRMLLGQGRGAWCCPNLYEEWEKLQQLGHMGHVREYTHRDVKDFLDKVGFDCKGMAFREGGGTAIGQMIFRFRPDLRPVMTYVGSPGRS